MVSLLRAEGVEYRYPASVDGGAAVVDVDVELAEGELLAVLGPNGAGKSTLLRLLAGLLRPGRGSVCLGGETLADLAPRERARRLAFVPQALTALPEVTVEAFVGYGRYAHRGILQGAGVEDRRAVQDALAAADLSELADRPLAEISGGQRQRALLARALAQEARLLLVDEPTGALDPEHQLRIFDLLSELCGAGRAVVVVTHDLNLASQFSDRALLLDGGRSVCSGPTGEVLRPEVLEPVYGDQLQFGSLPMPGGAGERTFVLPWKRERGSRG